MTENVTEKEWSESVKPLGEGRFELSYKQKVPLYDNTGKKVIGYNNNEGKSECTIEDLSFNLDAHRKSKQNLLKQKLDAENRMKKAENSLSMKGIPKTKTAEMIRLEKNLFALNQFRELDQAKAQMDDIDGQIKYEDDWIAMREKTISSLAANGGKDEKSE